ncbi:MAG: Hpt domain-containing protein [Planctomycetota bacterium]
MTQITVTEPDPAFQKLIELFLVELGARAEAFRRASMTGDRVMLRSLAHQLKGSAGGYGHVELGVLAGIVQQDCLDNVSHAKLKQSVDALIHACEEASSAEIVFAAEGV